jgi:hypothetical protein
MIDRNVVIVAHNARPTSLAVAEKVFPRSGSLRRKVYDYFVSCGNYGATDQEIETALAMSGNTVRPTRISLQKDNYIIDTGLTRKNQNGNECIVWSVPLARQGELF